MKHISEKRQDIADTRPALTSEGRLNQLIAMAYDMAEQQIRDGTASSQVITHFLKYGAQREKDAVELQILEKQKELIEAKTAALQAEKSRDELYSEAIKAFKEYSGDD